ncbi:MAG: hypothetical protein HZA03_06445 [Nitrospinae bacterium]|nr:hypothetical protein [Nitrospinota bacterium]
MRRIFAALLLITAFGAGAARAEISVEVLPVFYGNATALVEPLSKLLSEQGKIVVDPKSNSLIVRDWLANIRAVREELTKLDVRPRRVRLIAALTLRARGEDSVRWFFSTPDWGQGRLKDGLDLFFGVESTPLGAGKGLSTFGRQELLIDAGAPGKIVISERVTDAAFLFRYGIAEGYIAPQAQFRDIGTVITVTCAITDTGGVAATLTPTLTRLDGGSAIPFPKAHTLAVLEPGKAVVLGGSNNDPESFGARFLTVFMPDGTSQKVLLIMTARAE